MLFGKYILFTAFFFWFSDIHVIYRAVITSFLAFLYNKYETKSLNIKDSPKEYISNNWRLLAETGLLSFDIYYEVSYGFWFIIFERVVDLLLFIIPVAIMAYKHKDVLIPVIQELTQQVQSMMIPAKDDVSPPTFKKPEKRKIAFDD